MGELRTGELKLKGILRNRGISPTLAIIVLIIFTLIVSSSFFGCIEAPVVSEKGANITLTYPNEGEFLRPDFEYEISWTSRGITNVDVELWGVKKESDELVFVTTIAEKIEDTGSCIWRVPSDFVEVYNSIYKAESYVIHLSGKGYSYISDSVDNSDESITINHPNITLDLSDEQSVLVPGFSYTFDWVAQGVDNVNIELWGVNKETGELELITIIATGISSDDAFKWTVPNDFADIYNIDFEEDGYKIKIVDSSNSSFFTFCESDLIIALPKVNILSPSKTRILSAGTDVNISFDYEFLGADKIKLRLLKDDEYYLDIGDVKIIENSGRGTYKWHIPDNIEVGNNFKIGVCFPECSGRYIETNYNITIAPSITVTYPTSGEIFQVGDTVPIEWETKGIVKDVTILLALDDEDGRTYQAYFLSKNLKNEGKFTWKIPGSSSMVNRGWKIKVIANNLDFLKKKSIGISGNSDYFAIKYTTNLDTFIHIFFNDNPQLIFNKSFLKCGFHSYQEDKVTVENEKEGILDFLSDEKEEGAEQTNTGTILDDYSFAYYHCLNENSFMVSDIAWDNLDYSEAKLTYEGFIERMKDKPNDGKDETQPVKSPNRQAKPIDDDTKPYEERELDFKWDKDPHYWYPYLGDNFIQISIDPEIENAYSVISGVRDENNKTQIKKLYIITTNFSEDSDSPEVVIEFVMDVEEVSSYYKQYSDPSQLIRNMQRVGDPPIDGDPIDYEDIIGYEDIPEEYREGAIIFLKKVGEGKYEVLEWYTAEEWEDFLPEMKQDLIVYWERQGAINGAQYDPYNDPSSFPPGYTAVKVEVDECFDIPGISLIIKMIENKEIRFRVEYLIGAAGGIIVFIVTTNAGLSKGASAAIGALFTAISSEVIIQIENAIGTTETIIKANSDAVALIRSFISYLYDKFGKYNIDFSNYIDEDIINTLQKDMKEAKLIEDTVERNKEIEKVTIKIIKYMATVEEEIEEDIDNGTIDEYDGELEEEDMEEDSEEVEEEETIEEFDGELEEEPIIYTWMWIEYPED